MPRAMGTGNDSQVRMSSPIEAACIFRMTLPRWSFTVTSLMPRSKAICLLTPTARNLVQDLDAHAASAFPAARHCV